MFWCEKDPGAIAFLERNLPSQQSFHDVFDPAFLKTALGCDVLARDLGGKIQGTKKIGEPVKIRS